MTDIEQSKKILADIMGKIDEEVLGDDLGDAQQYEYDEFWSKRDFLRWTYACAKSARKNPWAMLFNFTDRIASAVGPHVVLPSTATNGHASLNQYTIFYAPAGIGKSSLLDKSRLFLSIMDEAEDYPLPTGEGLASIFVGTERDVMYTDKARVDVDEAEQIKKAVNERSGTTLWQAVRSMWVANKTSGQYGANKDRKRVLKPHTYRLCLSIYMQLSLLDIVLNANETSMGTPQRFLWAAVKDPFRKKGDPRPEPPESRSWMVPAWAKSETHPIGDFTVGRLVSMISDPRILEEIELIQEEIEFEERPAVESHLSLVTAKFAGALALYEGRRNITWGTNEDSDWELAKYAINASNKSRNAFVKLAAGEAKKNLTNQSWAKANAAVAEEDAAEQIKAERVQRIAEGLKNRMSGTTKTRLEIKNAISSNRRKNLPDVIDALIANGWAIEEKERIDESQRESTVYRFA